MKINFIKDDHTQHATKVLSEYYKDGLLPAEKKPYLSLHRKSYGPYLAVEGSNEEGYIQDAASQIATLGLGFNATPFFGVTHFLESWTNNHHSENSKDLIKAFKGFLKKHTGNRNLDLSFVNSGAEANEVALGLAFKNRKNARANKVMAFEGSFHGRFMVSLFSTWNKSKREPYQLSGYETTFMPFPAISHSNFKIKKDRKWLELWANPFCKSFDERINKFKSLDPQLDQEIASLMAVREELTKGEHYAIIIEPMQCEGGDRYSTSRFNNALLLLAKSYEVDLIFDEVQTGFGLGREFFWHRSFQLEDHLGNKIYPEYVTCAKKAQTGIVISSSSIEKPNKEYQIASVIRGFYQGLIIEQRQNQIIELEKKVDKKLSALVAKYKQLSSPRLYGMAFAFDIDNDQDIPKYISNRFKAGLLFYQAGANTLRFRLNSAYKDADLNFLFSMIDSLCDHIYNGKALVEPTPITHDTLHIDQDYLWHEKLIQARQGHCTYEQALDFIDDFFMSTYELKVEKIDSKNFEKYKPDIEGIEKEVYEPTRQTEIEKFQLTVENEPNIALGLLSKESKLTAISFAGLISLFPHERGLRRCRYFNDDSTLYMLDTTVRNESQGKGIGKFLKYAVELIGCTKSLSYIYGRNRDRLASSMLGVNTSLGLIPEVYISEDYPDDEQYRDVFVYRSPLAWKKLPTTLRSDMACPLKGIDISSDFIEKNIDKMINKVCLSNFVSLDFLKSVKQTASSAPKHLQHVYTASGQSEAVDKIAKSVYLNATNKKRNKFISFRGHHFGDGSFLSRSLSNEVDNYFPVTYLDNPTQDNFKEILEQLKQYLTLNESIAVFIEPIPQKLKENVPHSFLKQLKELCLKHETPLVYNETASANTANWVSNDPSLTPNCFYAYLGGQISMCFLDEKNYVEKPLMMISTWDGDALSLSQYNEGLRLFRELEDKASKEGHLLVEFNLTKEHSKLNPTRSFSYAQKLKLSGKGPFFPTVGDLL